MPAAPRSRGSWIDRVYLSRDGTSVPATCCVATREPTRTLAPGQGYTETAELRAADRCHRRLPVRSSSATPTTQIAELNAEGNNLGQCRAGGGRWRPMPTCAVSDVRRARPQRSTTRRGSRSHGPSPTSATASASAAAVDRRDRRLARRHRRQRRRHRARRASSTAARWRPARATPARDLLPAGRPSTAASTLFVRTDADGRGVRERHRGQQHLGRRPAPLRRDAHSLCRPGGRRAGAAGHGDERARRSTWRWMVRNQGIGLTSIDTWTDLLYLSPNADGSDCARCSAASTTSVSWRRTAATTAPARSTLPERHLGHACTWCCETGGPFEFIYTDNNRLRVGAVPDRSCRRRRTWWSADIVAPAVAPEGSAIDVTWTVRNQGQADADGTWTDR